MSRSMYFNVVGGIDVLFELTDDTLVAEIGGFTFEHDDDLERFASDCGRSLDEIRDILKGREDDDQDEVEAQG